MLRGKALLIENYEKIEGLSLGSFDFGLVHRLVGGRKRFDNNSASSSWVGRQRVLTQVAFHNKPVANFGRALAVKASQFGVCTGRLAWIGNDETLVTQFDFRQAWCIATKRLKHPLERVESEP